MPYQISKDDLNLISEQFDRIVPWINEIVTDINGEKKFGILLEMPQSSGLSKQYFSQLREFWIPLTIESWRFQPKTKAFISPGGKPGIELGNGVVVTRHNGRYYIGQNKVNNIFQPIIKFRKENLDQAVSRINNSKLTNEDFDVIGLLLGAKGFQDLRNGSGWESKEQFKKELISTLNRKVDREALVHWDDMVDFEDLQALSYCSSSYSHDSQSKTKAPNSKAKNPADLGSEPVKPSEPSGENLDSRFLQLNNSWIWAAALSIVILIVLLATFQSRGGNLADNGHCNDKAKKILVANFEKSKEDPFSLRLINELRYHDKIGNEIDVLGLSSYINSAQDNWEQYIDSLSGEKCLDSGLVVFGDLRSDIGLLDCHVSLKNLRREDSVQIRGHFYISDPGHVKANIPDRVKLVSDFIYGILYYYEGESNVSRDIFSRIVSTDSLKHFSELQEACWVFLGNIHAKNEEFGKSRDAYDQALSYNPQSRIAMRNLQVVASMANAQSQRLAVGQTQDSSDMRNRLPIEYVSEESVDLSDSLEKMYRGDDSTYLARNENPISQDTNNDKVELSNGILSPAKNDAFISPISNSKDSSDDGFPKILTNDTITRQSLIRAENSIKSTEIVYPTNRIKYEITTWPDGRVDTTHLDVNGNPIRVTTYTPPKE